MALCEPPGPLPATNWHCSYHHGSQTGRNHCRRLDAVCAWLGHPSFPSAVPEITLHHSNARMSNAEVAWRTHGAAAVRTGLGISGVIPDFVAIDVERWRHNTDFVIYC